VEGLQMIGSSFVTEFQTAEVSEPTERSFDDISGLSQTAAVRAFGATIGSQLRLDSPLTNLSDDRGRTIGRVSLKDLGFAARSPSSASDRWNLVEQRNGALPIGLVGRANFDHQGYASSIGNYVPFAALFRSVCRVGAGVVPPKTARIEALSMTARESRMAPRFPRRRKSRRCSSGQTLCWVQSFNRRQQVTPLPQPISAGSMFHGIPLLRMKIMPVKHSRSGTGGRPPCGEGSCFGNSGSISFHNLFGSNAAIFASLLDKGGAILPTTPQVLK